MKKITLLLLLISYLANAQYKKPKLIIGIVVDQMRYDYLYRFYDDFYNGGFKKMMKKGMNCQNTNYNYVPTYTGPGHASIYTGTTPKNHGIIANNWYSNQEKKIVNCVEDNDVEAIGGTDYFGKFSPKRLKAITITDQLKLTYTKSKVFSFSLKNRGAILPGGHLSDGSYWFDYSTGKFITSSYYTNKPLDWITQFNDEKIVDSMYYKTWNLSKNILEYTESREDNYFFEEILPEKETPTFPYDFKEMSNNLSLKYSLFGYSPYSNSVLFELAKRAILNEKLGRDEFPDFINISISSTDIIGHAFGPFSKEIQDTYIKLDKDLGSFIQFLNNKVGKGNYVLFLTADHAVEPIPQYLIDHRLPANYFYKNDFKDTIHQFLRKLYPKKNKNEILSITRMSNQQIYLNKDFLSKNNVDEANLKQQLKQKILSIKGIKNVFFKEQFLDGKKYDGFIELIANGVNLRESGDIIYMLEPGYLSISNNDVDSKKGTSHGSPYGYDTHVPLLWYGSKTTKKNVEEKINITDISPTLKQILYLQKTNASTGNLILKYFE